MKKVIETNLLKSKMVAEGKSSGDCAKAIGIALSSYSEKLRGKRLFTTEEVKGICHFLRIDDPSEICEIFLP